MNTWKTDLMVTPTSEPIRIADKIITIGSCFAEVVGNYLINNKFECQVNPFGTLYNPISIHQVVVNCLLEEIPLHENYVRRDDSYYHYQYHSSITASSRELLENRIQKKLDEFRTQVLKSNYLVITYGTAFVYELAESGMPVANCHKMPAQLFHKKLLSVESIVNSFHDMVQVLKKFNPALKIILTVSPVRHLKDSLELNSVSKSILRIACHELQSKEVAYFPAFEIMMDDLRDYRFYKKDRIHPTEEAEEYILEKFEDQFFDADTKSIVSKWKNLRLALNHRPFNGASIHHQTFLRNTLKQLTLLNGILNLENEIKWIEQQLATN